jgi:hypothetical protein
VLSEHAADWFDNIPAGEGRSISPYMSMTTTVTEAKRAQVPAVTHIDGTARLQTVDKHSNPLYHMLIERFFKLTKVTDSSAISHPNLLHFTLLHYITFPTISLHPSLLHSIPFSFIPLHLSLFHWSSRTFFFQCRRKESSLNSSQQMIEFND